jgi:hypothetical protein
MGNEWVQDKVASTQLEGLEGGSYEVNLERHGLQGKPAYERATDEGLCCSRRHAVTVLGCSLYVTRSSSVEFFQWEIVR